MICDCTQTTRGDLLDWFKNTNSTDFRLARRDIGVAIGCGSCVPALVELLYEFAGEAPQVK